MSQVMGSGFKVYETEDDCVMLFAAGSGISPIRSAIEDANPKGLKGRKVKLFYGAQDLKSMAYQDKFDEWKELGIKVTPVISQPDGTDWTGATGYVQDVAKADGVPEKCAMLLCGMKGMAEGVKELASDAGVAEDKVLANF